ncbi:imelysin family protein [Thiomicrospira sp. WB1]|uniref:imelysin family protein n=1 Tax=Thiomicrospira sp. WB1 TaxID=1685380 RepID=UPI0007469033|nr:imelysin family protein [Thiomicrospira sp. WB1]KUJ72564.1 hypothetical protein AVO41_01790 [Thiomicrospira sp. WB1]
MKLKALTLAVATSVTLMGCAQTQTHSNASELAQIQKVLQTNADMAYAAYSDSLATALELKAAIADLRMNPSDDTLAAAKKAWLTAREPYGQTEVYRFRLSPIDSTNYQDEDGPEGDINAWPLGEALIDYTVAGNDFGNDQLGVTEHQTPVNDGQPITVDDLNHTIIGNPDIAINRDLLAKTATAEDEHDVLAGYHAIEFLLWGQDLNRNASPDTQGEREKAVKTWQAPNLAQGGQRPVSDFISNADNDAADRRLTYLAVAVDKLIDDLRQVKNGWAPGQSDNYRAQFTQVTTLAEGREKMAEILTGMGTLSEGELAGERMQIALSADSQEDEHSCFSDNTHRDIVLNALGIQNSYYGDYQGYDSDFDGKPDAGTVVTGYGFDDYLADLGQTQLGTKLEAQFANTEQGYQAIDRLAREGTPVDVVIMNPMSEDAKPMRDTILSLNKQSAEIAKLAKALGVEKNVVDPDASACDTSNPTAQCD